jgi:hypothetical protein
MYYYSNSFGKLCYFSKKKKSYRLLWFVGFFLFTNFNAHDMTIGKLCALQFVFGEVLCIVVGMVIIIQVPVLL